MNKLLKLALTSLVVLSIGSTVASADVAKGQKLFTKKLKGACSMTGAAMAGKHTQDEWSEIKEAGKFKEEIGVICPETNLDKIKDSWIDDIYDFSFEYASDSGNVPSC